MKTTRHYLFSLVLGHASLAVLPATAQETAPADDALRPIAYLNGVTQQTLGDETAALAGEIDALMAELRRNGFPEQSLAKLRQLVDQLGEVGADDMVAIAERLRGLGEDPGADARQTVAGAYVAQQAVESRLKALANKIAVSQLREETVRRLEAIIARQLAAQRETRAASTTGATGTRKELLLTDQRGVGEDLHAFFQAGETLLANLRESVSGGRPAADAPAQPGFAERINAPLLNTYASEALDRLQADNYVEAYARQNALLAELNKILQGILSSQTKEERLSSALMQVAALRQEQEARDRAQEKTDAEEAQAAADEAKLLAAKVAAIDKQAAEAIKKAQEALQKQADEAARNPAAQPPDPSAKPDSATRPKAGDEQVAAVNPAQPPPADPQAAEGEATPGEKPDAANPAQPPPPGEAAAALAAAENALRRELAAEQAREAAAQQQQQMAQNGQTPPAGRDPQSQQQRQQGANEQNQQQQQGRQQPQQGEIQDGRESQSGDDGGYVANKPVDGAGGPAQTVGALRESEREAMQMLQNERYPAEYAPWVRQYWRNLAQDQ